MAFGLIGRRVCVLSVHSSLRKYLCRYRCSQDLGDNQLGTRVLLPKLLSKVPTIETLKGGK
jgi:hypothetical protein